MTFFFIFLFVVVVGIIWFINSGIQLPKNIDTLIKEVQAEPIPALIKGETGLAQNGSVSIFYESIQKVSNPKASILLINGHTQTLLDWYPYFYEPLVDAGYQVIRFDNRGIGQSDWMTDWGKPHKYDLEDMAQDVIAVLDKNDIEKAHVIGMSMGGMIGQHLAISHSDRVLSLTSIMSTGFYFDKNLVSIPPPFLRNIVRLYMRYLPTISREESMLKLHLGVLRLLVGQGDYFFDDKMNLQKGLFEMRKRKGFNRKAADQHSYAIKKSGSRYKALAELDLPVLVVHGTTDPLIDFSHAQKYAALIPNAQKLFIEGMGHDLPKLHTPEITRTILAMIEKVSYE